MKIAIIGSFIKKIPLEEGKIHTPLMLTHDLAIQLSNMGHDVTFFGRVDASEQEKNPKLNYNDLSFDSNVNQAGFHASPIILQNLNIVLEQSYFAEVLALNDFDLFYTWAGFLAGPLAKLANKPVVLTHHDSTNIEAYNLMFDSFGAANIFLIPISEYMRKIMTFPEERTLGVVHHGIKINKSIQTDTPENAFCWVGRVVPSKGLHTAIEIAKLNGLELKIIGQLSDSFADVGDVSDYKRKIELMISEQKNIRFLGALSQEATRKEIAASKGLIFPLEGTESFALTVIEAITAGVPVIASKKSPLTEIIDQDKTGFLCSNIQEFSEAVKKIDDVNRSECRAIGEKKFSIETMANGYEREFQAVLQRCKNNS